ncbi:hypothetical protein, conserved [Plasmodium gonderi]|uniref:Uncharacterized protein n=1 Tax=Plasmodium gonderi TaxID=77519 RepID=A0A1Y1JF29_PLAGO|nr:hypothetical protein, conserved [Plasmodium gonderi]GAW79817.1 hypothetical protein, conserved [Plasmodium gonderi]
MEESTCRSVERIFEDVSFNKRDRKRLQFDDKKLNRFFENGMLNYSLVEIVGISGSGKTQFALTLCAEHLLKILEENRQTIVFYVYFNRMFPIHRLKEIIKNKLDLKDSRIHFKTKNIHSNSASPPGSTSTSPFPSAHEKRAEQLECPTDIDICSDWDNWSDANNCNMVSYSDRANNCNTVSYSNREDTLNGNMDDTLNLQKENKTQKHVLSALKNFYIQKINDEKELFSLIEKDIYHILRYHKISLLVIDSMNCVFNGNENLDAYKKCQLFTRVSICLKNLAYEKNFFLLLLNNSQLKKEYSGFCFNIFDYVINCPCSNTIIIFKKKKKNNKIARKMSIKYSEFLRKYKSINFEINDSGFRAL